jgi:nucleoside-diphosphate-sugar epimerase
VEGDVADPALAGRLAELGPELFFHLAVARDTSTPAARLEAVRTNVGGTAVLLEAAGASRGARFVHFGGALEAAGPAAPIGHYAATKASSSLLCRAREDVHAVVLRPLFVYGPGQPGSRLIPTLLRAARDDAPVTLVAGPRRDWIHVDDVVDAALAVAAAPLERGAVVAAGTGHQWANEEVAAAVERVTGRRLAVERGGAPRPWDGATPPADPSGLAALGVTPRPLEDGLAATWAAGG